MGIREGNEGNEFGEMEAGPTDGRLVSPLLVRALDDSLLAAQGTPTPAQIEVEIARRTDAAVARYIYSTSEDNLYFRILKRFEFPNELSLSLLPICTRRMLAVLWLERISRAATVHGARQDRTVVGPRARAGYLR